jgi:hypothetical protein
MQRILKRLAVWLLEALAGAFLLGGLLGALSLPNFLKLLPGVWALGLGVAAILFIHGYYLTTALFGVVWRSEKIWLYPAIAAALFVIHVHVAFVRLKPDISSQGKATELPFLAGGACIVAGCAFVGNWLLRKWIPAGRNGPDPLNREIAPGNTGG